ncbi:MAG: 4-(cytidine 5'-diphospho)-2-C-methyl-D-erythritol kinase [Bacteroidota bacterium]
MSSLTLFPHAKVNLGLFIKGKRADGYHLLETLLFPVPDLTDHMILTPRKTPGCELTILGIELEGDLSDNLCVRAYRLLQQDYPDLPGVSIQLTKHIPAGAGLGGGSSDAAFTLKGLNQLFDLGISDETLAKKSAVLGADVPFFVYGTPQLAKGIGTELAPVSLAFPYTLKLYPQPIHSSTIAAYKALDYTQFNPHRDLASILNQPISTWKDTLDNDLEVPVFRMYPVLREIKSQIYAEGALYAAMSGSGSCMFGIFEA